VARVNLSRAQATALASRLLTALEDNQDAAPVPPAYNKADEFARIVAESLGIDPVVAAKGLGIRTRGGRGQGRGRGNRPQPVPDARGPAHPQQAQGLGPPEESHPQSQPASNTIEARLSFHSVSETNTAAKRRRVTSAHTSTPLILL
jgi:hypothetical protein